jgi:hypothetical protein
MTSQAAKACALYLCEFYVTRELEEAMSDKDKVIVTACNSAWDETWSPGVPVNSKNCSGFFKSVTKKLNIVGVPDDVADSLIDFMDKHWMCVKTGLEGVNLVRKGFFVAAGLKASEQTPKVNKDSSGKVIMKDGKPETVAVQQGHVAVIVDGDFYRAKYPKCWCGSIGGAQSKGDLSIGEIFSTADRDKVHYFMYSAAVATPPADTAN